MNAGVRTMLLPFVLIVPALAIPESVLPPGVESSLNLRKAPHDSLSVYVENVKTGEPVLAWNEEVPRNPGSVIKLLTTLAALDILGPTYTWKTEVYVVGETNGSVVNGDLLLKGYGDPFLVAERVWQMLREVRKKGVSKINGDLLIDDSYFDVSYQDPGEFDGAPLRAYNVVPNALLMNFKVVRYHFEPDRESAGVNVRIDPPLENLRVENRLKVVDGRCRGYQRGITITPNEAGDHMTLTGQFPRGCKSYAIDRTVLGHNEFAFGLFKNIWLESGGEFSGSFRKAVAPADAEPFLIFESWPLADVISKINKHSNNVMARQLVYTLGAERYAVPGTEDGGRRVIEDWLGSNGLSNDGLRFGNGSGLSRETRISAKNLGELLRYAWNSPFMPEFLSSLSLTGLDGTLAQRFRNDPLTGRAHVKTGRLDHVAAVAGYVQARSGRRYTIVALQNHTDVHRGPGEEVQAALLRWVYEQ